MRRQPPVVGNRGSHDSGNAAYGKEQHATQKKEAKDVANGERRVCLAAV
jgi:hypothetical protein